MCFAWLPTLRVRPSVRVRLPVNNLYRTSPMIVDGRPLTVRVVNSDLGRDAIPNRFRRGQTPADFASGRTAVIGHSAYRAGRAFTYRHASPNGRYGRTGGGSHGLPAGALPYGRQGVRRGQSRPTGATAGRGALRGASGLPAGACWATLSGRTGGGSHGLRRGRSPSAPQSAPRAQKSAPGGTGGATGLASGLAC
jgi:hypothetical protein